MARMANKPPGRERGVPASRLRSEKFVEARINQGMITMIDPADIPPSALQFIKNATVRFDRTTRRPGTVLLTPEKPNDESVLKLATLKKKDGDIFTVRFTPTTLSLRQALAWTNISATPALTLSGGGRYSTAVILDELIFANDGTTPIYKIDFTALTAAPLGNAPEYRHVIGFFNRAVGFAHRGVNEVEVGWSADGDIEEWDSTVDETAGKTPLFESTDDLSDFIQTGFAFTNVMVILREKSVWLATKQPIPHNPFYFYAAVPGIGTDAPYSAKIIGQPEKPSGIAWIDRRTGTVYAYAPGSVPEAIGRPIEKSILGNVDDPKFIFGGYAPIPNEYSVYIPSASTKTVQAWTYNFRNKAWTYGEYYDLSSVDDTDLGTAAIMADQLIGTADDLLGTADDLSPEQPIIVTRALGRNDGTIMLEDVNEDLDAPHDDYEDGIPYNTVLVSKVYTIPEDDIYVARVVIEYQANRGGEFKLEYSKNGGAKETSWRTAKIVTPTKVGEPALLIWRRPLRCRRFAWRLTTQAGNFEILSYEVHVYPSGQSKE